MTTRAAPQLSDGWMHRAACRGSGDPAFIADTVRGARPALATCHTCPVLAECAAYGRATHGHGVWGGAFIRDGKPARRGSPRAKPQVSA
jgi:hypothetical protein